MQLILVLAVLMMLGGKNGAPRPGLSNSDILETLKYISDGNGEMDKIIREVEQVSEIISAIAPIATAFGNGATPFDESDDTSNNSESKMQGSDATPPDIGICLKPIVNIADDRIYNALSQAV